VTLSARVAHSRVRPSFCVGLLNHCFGLMASGALLAFVMAEIVRC
jgi:hypothetical protein